MRLAVGRIIGSIGGSSEEALNCFEELPNCAAFVFNVRPGAFAGAFAGA